MTEICLFLTRCTRIGSHIFVTLCPIGSQDDTLKIAEENARLHENVIVIKNDSNMGLNYTLNHSLEYADTENVARMDGDDISFPTRFEKEIQFLDEHPEYAVVSAPMIYFDEDGEFGRGAANEGEVFKKRFNSGSSFCHAPCMARTAVFKEVGGYSVHQRLLRVEDYNLWTKIYAAGYKGYNLGEHLYAMRDDRNAIQRRTVKARMNGIYAHWLAYQMLDLSLIAFVKYAIANVVRAYVPLWVYTYFHKRNFSK